MGTKFNHLEPHFSSDKQVHWQTICELLGDRHYEQAARHLTALQFPEHGDDPYFTSILAAAHQICLVCRQVCAETDLHQQAYHETLQRERALQQQLILIFDLIEHYLEPGNLPDELAKVESVRAGAQRDGEENGRSWWQRLRTRLEPKSGKVTPPAKDNTETLVETAVNPPPAETTTTSGPTLTVYCLGPFRAYMNDKSVDQWQGIKSKSLFKYLVVNRQRPVPLERLMDIFWQENGPDSARRNLYQAIYLLRQTIQPVLPDFPTILSENGCYELNPLMGVWLDSEIFERYVENGRQLETQNRLSDAITAYETADNLYNGDFLIEDPYEEWPAAQRENLRQAHHLVLERLSRHHYVRQNWALCSTYYKRLLAADNCREDAHRGLMRVYFFQGQRHLALRQYYCCVEALQTELDVDPMPETVALHHQIQKNRLHFSSPAKLKQD